MKIRAQRPGDRGSATLVVVVLLFIMAALALGNNHTLRQLHEELDLIEHRQLTNPSPTRKPPVTVPVIMPEPEATASPEAEPGSPAPSASPGTESPPSVLEPEPQPEP